MNTDATNTTNKDGDQLQPPKFDPSMFTTDPYVKRIEKPWGYELHWVPEGMPYMGKIMHVIADECLSLQIHDQKQESYFMMSGRAALEWEDNTGAMITTEMEPGLGYRTSVGQKHRIRGITDCDIIEASTPEMGTTWRLEDKYARPNETEAQRKLERAEN
jgi:mannose-6-phosphate isomerase-like protein (cupin superfamily)